LGKRFAKRTPLVAQGIQDADPATLVQQVRDTGWAHVEVEGEPVEINADEGRVTERPREGWAAATGDGEAGRVHLGQPPRLGGGRRWPGRCCACARTRVRRAAWRSPTGSMSAGTLRTKQLGLWRSTTRRSPGKCSPRLSPTGRSPMICTR